jgi:hypothetical protein
MNFDEFNRVFCKGLFKEALMKVNERFESVTTKQNQKDSTQLFVKIGEYQRQQMMNGLDPKHEKFGYGINILNSLNELADRAVPAQRDYRKFMDEVNQKKIDMMEARGELDPAIVKANSEKRAKKMEKVDPFIASIKFIEDGRGL